MGNHSNDIKFVEKVYPFQRFRNTTELRDAIMDGCAPSLRKEGSNTPEALKEYFWNLLEACWGEPSIRPNIGIIIDALDYFERDMVTA